MMFSDRLKAARAALGLTQQQLADAVGMKKASISGLELGTSKKPSAGNLLPLARAVRVSPDWLITGKKDHWDVRAGKNVRLLRKERVLSLSQAANRADIGLLRYSAIESGECSATMDELQRIAMVYEVTVDEIIGYPTGADIGPRPSDLGMDAREPSNEDYCATQWERDAITALRNMDSDRRRRALQNLEDCAELVRMKKTGNDG